MLSNIRQAEALFWSRAGKRKTGLWFLCRTGELASTLTIWNRFSSHSNERNRRKTQSRESGWACRQAGESLKLMEGHCKWRVFQALDQRSTSPYLAMSDHDMSATD